MNLGYIVVTRTALSLLRGMCLQHTRSYWFDNIARWRRLVVPLSVRIAAEQCDANSRQQLLTDHVQAAFKSVRALDLALRRDQLDATAAVAKDWSSNW